MAAKRTAKPAEKAAPATSPKPKPKLVPAPDPVDVYQPKGVEVRAAQVTDEGFGLNGKPAERGSYIVNLDGELVNLDKRTFEQIYRKR